MRLTLYLISFYTTFNVNISFNLKQQPGANIVCMCVNSCKRQYKFKY